MGKTSSDSGATAGVELKSDGNVRITKDGGSTVAFNRLNSEGTIVTFQKDGSTMGSIQVQNTDNLSIQGNSSHCGIEFGSDAVFPHKNSSNVDNQIDLGHSTLRWRDIYK